MLRVRLAAAGVLAATILSDPLDRRCGGSLHQSRPEVRGLGRSGRHRGSFLIFFAGTVSLQDKLYFDQSGEQIREIVNYHWSGTIANSATGKWADDSGAKSNTFKLIDGVLHLLSSGTTRHVTVPGLGIIWQDSGHRTFDDFAGWDTTPHATPGDVASPEACAYLGS